MRDKELSPAATTVPSQMSSSSTRRSLTRSIIVALSSIALLFAGAAGTQAATGSLSAQQRATIAAQHRAAVTAQQRAAIAAKTRAVTTVPVPQYRIAAGEAGGRLVTPVPVSKSKVSATSVHAPRAVAGSVIFGAFSSLPGLTTAASVTTREAQIGHKYAVNSHYYDWADPFPGPVETADALAGRTPMETWWGIDPRQIVNGSQDALITTRAKAVAAYGKPLFLRWGAEMNGNWYAWSGSAVGNDPSVFVAAWRHIHDIFAAVDVHNVSWVWAPNADSHPGGVSITSWNNWRNYYPGDAYVDWVGIDGYNWGVTDSWQSFGQVFGPVYADYAARKPIMIAETGSVEAGGNKAAWIADAAAWMKAHQDISALVYFDTNQSSSGLDWRTDSSTAALNAYITVARDPYFSGHAG